MPYACVYVPGMAVQAALRQWLGPGDHEPAFALFRRVGERRVVLAVNTPAAEGGVRVGMTVSAAESACTGLLTLEDDPARTTAALHTLADALFAFGPVVATAVRLSSGEKIAFGDAVFVDVTRVHGVSVTVSSLVGAARSVGLVARAGLAGAPWAALVLASEPSLSDAERACTSAGVGREAAAPLARLPLASARLPDVAHTALDMIGIRTIGALLALPVAGLERRFGGATGHIARALAGRARIELVPFVPDEAIVESMRIDEGSADDLQALGFRVKAVVDRAARRLVGRGLGAEALALTVDIAPFFDGPNTRPSQHLVELELGHPHQDGALLRELLGDRLAALPPPGPVTGLRLLVVRASPVVPIQLGLFDDPEPRETVHASVARLASLLGDDRFGVALCEDFRPERAYVLGTVHVPKCRGNGRSTAEPTPAEPIPALAGAPPGPRPTRLLREPRPLPGRPLDGLPSSAIDGPERLVSGWWDDSPMARDYFVVADRWGRRSWIFRELASSRWFLHGYFD